MGLLISGPAGANKSKAARVALLETVGPSALIDYQELYAALAGIDRLPDGRYPERLPEHRHLLPLAEYVRRAAISGAVLMEITPIVTNSDGDARRRAFLLSELGPNSSERILDPGRDVVEERLSRGGILSEQCNQAINRWYGRL